MTFKINRDLITGITFCAVGLAAALVIIPNGVQVPGSVKIAPLSPDFWPKIIAWASVAASVALIVESTLLRQPHAGDDEDDAIVAAEYNLATLPATVRIIVLIVALFGFYFTLNTYGLVVTSIVLIAAMMLFFGERKYVLIASLAVGVPLALFGFFRYVANVPIPLGIFG